MSTTPSCSPCEPAQPPARAGWFLAAREWARRRRTTRYALSAVVFILGLTLILAGLFMLVLPGPGLAAIILGLVVLASEFGWAERLLAPVRAFAARGLRALRRK